MSSEPPVTIVIPTHNRNELLRRTLGSLSAIELPNNYQQTIVIENGGQFGAKEVVKDASPRLRACYEYFEQGNKSAALNYVLGIVKDDLLVFFDDDVRVSKDMLLAYSDAAMNNPECFFGGPVNCDHEVTPEPWVFLPRSARVRPLEGSPVYFLGFNWAAFATHLRECGQFDLRVGPGGTTGARGQETLMQEKLKEHGYLPMHVGAGMVWHYVPAERCSERWALQRAYQNGITSGLKMKGDMPKLFGVTRLKLRYLPWSLCWALFYSGLTRKEKAHKYWRDYHFKKGIISGICQTAERRSGRKSVGPSSKE